MLEPVERRDRPFKSTQAGFAREGIFGFKVSIQAAVRQSRIARDLGARFLPDWTA